MFIQVILVSHNEKYNELYADYTVELDIRQLKYSFNRHSVKITTTVYKIISLQICIIKRISNFYSFWLSKRCINIYISFFESNVLAYQLVGFEKTGMLLYPLYSYGEVDKSQIEYSDLLFNTARRMIVWIL